MDKSNIKMQISKLHIKNQKVHFECYIVILLFTF